MAQFKKNKKSYFRKVEVKDIVSVVKHGVKQISGVRIIQTAMKHYRRIYPYICSHCKKPRYTLVFIRKNRGLCHRCIKIAPVPGQKKLF